LDFMLAGGIRDALGMPSAARNVGVPRVMNWGPPNPLLFETGGGRKYCSVCVQYSSSGLCMGLQRLSFCGSTALLGLRKSFSSQNVGRGTATAVRKSILLALPFGDIWVRVGQLGSRQPFRDESC
jgi:hypothetical protein